VRTAAYGALAGVTTPADFNRLCGLLNQAQEDDVKALQAGLKNALAKESSDMQYKMVAGQMAARRRRDAPRTTVPYRKHARSAADRRATSTRRARRTTVPYHASCTVTVTVPYRLPSDRPDPTVPNR